MAMFKYLMRLYSFRDLVVMWPGIVAQTTYCDGATNMKELDFGYGLFLFKA